nr:immunoglobulin light chain junction region [Macaca mulatta]MOX69046.1 immunoglobulin light chain junction region [Macaca mulatta]MOX69058.1 immunoglobulin light chain junction region [Macaca mulatta]MOX69093.1 immunoglobulin light chain junction region [Macaca mulatta]MOX69104.1 immunoglobulin light chain junction region [Macaca mulatta]
HYYCAIGHSSGDYIF